MIGDPGNGGLPPNDTLRYAVAHRMNVADEAFRAMM
jgi:hypothetical protein